MKADEESGASRDPMFEPYGSRRIWWPDQMLADATDHQLSMMDPVMLESGRITRLASRRHRRMTTADD